MPTPEGPDNSRLPQPTPASDDEKAALTRALLKENSTELFGRLLQENDASRVDASLSSRKRRE
jgi:hypothetical protein